MIAEVENAIVIAIRGVLGQTVKTVEALPGPWSQDALAQASDRMPGVWVYFDGGNAGQGKGRLVTRFLVYAVTSDSDASGDRKRQIGAYEIVERVVPTLDYQPVAQLGSLRFDGVRVLIPASGWGEVPMLIPASGWDGVRVLIPASSLHKAVVAYEMTFTLEMTFLAPRDIGELANFSIYSATHEVGDGPVTESYADIPTGNEET